jgi:hypothetical protein
MFQLEKAASWCNLKAAEIDHPPMRIVRPEFQSCAVTLEMVVGV